VSTILRDTKKGCGKPAARVTITARMSPALIEVIE
jgi:hypothetical protein